MVFSWDGAGEVGNGLFSRFLDLKHEAHMTFFLSGLYLLPESKKRLYDLPNNPRGASDIGYLTDEHIKETLKNVRRAWLEGHEIGTHFNGHFCGDGYGSVCADAAAVAQRDRPGQVLREGVAHQHRLDRSARAALRLRQGARRRPYALPARPGQPAAHRPRTRLAL